VIAPTPSFTDRLWILCRGEPEAIAKWLKENDLRWLLFCCVTILIGCGIYGGSLGLWRSPLQALYSAVKFPLVVFLVVLFNAALNGMLAQLLGLHISFYQTSVAILMSFTIVALVLASLTPISLFVLWNTPPLSSSTDLATHHFTKMLHVLAIAYAGVIANVRLYRLLERLADAGRPMAGRILFAWLAGNLFLGSQFVWILRPFIGSPFLDVQFLRPNAFDGNFYENIFDTIRQIAS
jgi:hypothetical protein